MTGGEVSVEAIMSRAYLRHYQIRDAVARRCLSDPAFDLELLEMTTVGREYHQLQQRLAREFGMEEPLFPDSPDVEAMARWHENVSVLLALYEVGLQRAAAHEENV